MITLYIKDNTGALRFWSIEDTFDGIEMSFGQVGGAVQYKQEIIEEGKGGRDIDEQIESRMQSRINKQKDKGYVEDIELAKSRRAVNSLGLKKPMLAMPHGKVKDLYTGASYVQNKYDGNRCLIHNDGVSTFAYTRNGKPFTTLSHILDGIKIPEGMTIDGELYCHNTPLQTIVSWGKRKQENTKKLKFIAYDIIADDPYKDRLALLEKLDLGKSAEVATTALYDGFTPDSLNTLLRKTIDNNYEGLIMRKGDVGYEDGKRSKSLIKVKAWISEECRVKDVVASEDGWGILVCVYKGKEFRVSAPGTIQYKTHVLNQKQIYIGKDVTVEFANLTLAGVPFHPVAVAFRDYE